MKAARNIMMLILFAVGIAQAQDITVNGERKVNTDFSKYRTFSWLDPTRPIRLIEYTTYREVPEKASAERQPAKADRKHKRDYRQEVVYSYAYIIPSENEAMNSNLKAAVEDEMEGRGYKKDAASPDLLLSYKIFDRSTSVKAFDNPPTTIDMNKEVQQPSDTITYELKPGTVMISLIDAHTSQVVWEGFASGVADPNDVISDETKVKQAVNLIFKKYEFRGDKYSMN